ncbi:MAG: carboxymuconolactone decarboxylase family protein [Alphaproteobacteria bacterium]|nr:carboxymuconolactone decarboxylase family protein [Alphaproteobacteria bacterium]
MARLDPIPVEKMTPEQKALHDRMIGTRKQLSGPFGVWLRNPALADSADKVVRAVRQDGKLEKRLYELIVLVVVRHWSAPYAWAAHEAPARAAGLSDDTIEAIRARRKPNFAKADEALIYDAATELLAGKVLSAATYDKLIAQYGLDTTIELITIAGLYSMVSTVLNGFDVPPSDGSRPFG